MSSSSDQVPEADREAASGATGDRSLVADPLQTGGALTPPTQAGADRPDPVPPALGWSPMAVLWDGYRRRVLGTPDVEMVPGTMVVDGRRVRYAVSDNEDAHGPDGPDSPPVWAVNIHGYFAGGGMYWRESARLAHALGWRLVNPSLPGFGGSDPLRSDQISLPGLAEQVRHVMDHVGAGPAVVLGHSMGAAVAAQYADANSGSTLGLVLRDGVATPAWKTRRGILPALLTPISPGLAIFADLSTAMVLDLPDLFIGRLASTLRSILPDLGRSLQTMAGTLPVGSVLMDVDLRAELAGLAAAGVPILPEWGCFDRVVGDAAAAELAAASGTHVQWVPGGHSWMLARPQGQADLLTLVPSGHVFVDRVEQRWRLAAGPRGELRAAV